MSQATLSSSMLVMLSLVAIASGISLESADAQLGSSSMMRREVQNSTARRMVGIDASGEAYLVDVDSMEAPSPLEPGSVEAKEFEARHHGIRLPPSCVEFFEDDCKLHDLLPDPKNGTEVKMAFIACCADPDLGGHFPEEKCTSVANEKITDGEATDAECEGLVALYKAHVKAHKEGEKSEKLLLQARAKVVAEGSQKESSLDDALEGKAPSHLPASARPPVNAQGYKTIGTTPVYIRGNHGSNDIIIYYHGWGGTCTECSSMQSHFSNAGYAVISPCDHKNHAAILFTSGEWGKRVYNDVKRWAGNRRIGLIGYSAGGGAAIKVSYDNGWSNPKVPVVSVHGAPLLAGWGFAQGPILYLTGDGEPAWMNAGQHTPFTSWNKFFWTTWGKKVYMKWGSQATHAWPCFHATPEWQAAVQWMDCYLKGDSSSCENHKSGICKLSGVKDCLP